VQPGTDRPRAELGRWEEPRQAKVLGKGPAGKRDPKPGRGSVRGSRKPAGAAGGLLAVTLAANTRKAAVRASMGYAGRS
jgi:hypothetical protein